MSTATLLVKQSREFSYYSVRETYGSVPSSLGLTAAAENKLVDAYIGLGEAWIDGVECRVLSARAEMNSGSSGKGYAFSVGTAGPQSVAGVRLEEAHPRAEPVQAIASTPIGIWQGTVIEVDFAKEIFSADLEPIRGSNIEVAGEISFDQLNPDDMELLRPGAIFYVEQFRHVVRRQVSFVQKIRLRRAPRWSRASDARMRQALEAIKGVNGTPRIAD